MIEINNIKIRTPSSFSVSIIDISNAERNEKGEMLIDRIATKIKLEIQWKSLSNDEISTLLKSVKDIYFNVNYPDPQEGTNLTKIFYVGDRTAPMYNFNSGNPKWENLKMNFIEK